MKHLIVIFTLAATVFSGYSQQISVYFGSGKLAFKYAPPNSNLEGVYVINGTLNGRIEYETISPEPVEWFSFDSGGTTRRTPLHVTGTTLNNIVGDKGYIAVQGSKEIWIWVTDYLKHPLDIIKIIGGDCEQIYFSGCALPYHNEYGRTLYIPRDITLKYSDITFIENPLSSTQEERIITKTISGDDFSMNAPLCNTAYTITGDQILKFWGEKEQSFVTEEYKTTAVKGKASVIQNGREVPNEVNAKPEDGGLGGSAPAEIEFRSVMNTPIASYVAWEFSDNDKFDNVYARYTDTSISYTFKDEGTTYIKLTVANSDNTCEWDTTFTVNIGASRLEAPNFFSPGSSSGNNLEWRVAYSSIVSFQCWIFNRWGIKMYESNNPAQGWDGRYGGKFVPSGVYFYIVEAKGSDEKKYKLKGDINILRSKN